MKNFGKGHQNAGFLLPTCKKPAIVPDVGLHCPNPAKARFPKESHLPGRSRKISAQPLLRACGWIIKIEPSDGLNCCKYYDQEYEETENNCLQERSEQGER
jgi:hypothetical protein